MTTNQPSASVSVSVGEKGFIPGPTLDGLSVDEGTLPSPSPSNGPDLWRAILADMPEGAIIAGGAVRDYLLGVQPKDIDVFFCVSKFNTKLDWTGYGPLGEDRRAEYDAMNAIQVVQRGMVGGFQVDAVGVSLPQPEGSDHFAPHFSGQAVIETFDFGLTRCWFDGELHDTPDARYDREHKTVTLLLTDRMARATDRFTRFNERMGGDWTCRLLRDGAGHGTASAPRPDVTDPGMNPLLLTLQAKGEDHE